MRFHRPSMVCVGAAYPYEHAFTRLTYRRWYWPFARVAYRQCSNCDERRVAP